MDSDKSDKSAPELGALPPFLRGGLETLSGGGKMARIWGAFMEQLTRSPSLWLDIAREAQQKQWELLSAMSPLGGQAAADAKAADGEAADAKAAPAKTAKDDGAKSAKSAKDQTADARPKADGDKAAQAGGKKKPIVDRRFAAREWRENPFFNFLMHNYRLTSDAVRRLVDRVEMDPEDKKRLRFACEQYLAAISPANFPATNPEVINATIESGGENLIQGMKQMMRDMEHGIVTNTDRAAFVVGRDLANTPGKVVAENPVMQLIEYAPQTERVYDLPVLIIPPFINKYYILDLQPHNSLVRHLTDQGFRVFLVSWINAGAREAHLEWDDYLALGVLDNIAAVADIVERPKMHLVGYCVGGTLLAGALALLAEEKRHPAASLTFLTTMLDFEDTGDLALFVDDDAVADYERRFADGGLMSGADVARTFAALRPDDLIWPYVVSSYYKGEKPPAFDLLYWNSDSTNLPGKMFAYYLRSTYLQNDLAAGRCVMRGAPIHLEKIAAPTFTVACERDHIVPWQTAYLGARLLNAPVDFILGASGHVAGVVNPPSQKKGAFRALPRPAQAGQLPPTADAWRKQAKIHSGSWWPRWTKWLAAVGGGRKIAAPKSFGNYRYRPLGDAPGSFVTAPRPEVK